jgi:hypothetical protein
MTHAVRDQLELFGPVGLAYLMDGPKPQTTLDGHVPSSVLERLRSAGIINARCCFMAAWQPPGGTWPTKKSRLARRALQSTLCRDVMTPASSMECWALILLGQRGQERLQLGQVPDDVVRPRPSQFFLIVTCEAPAGKDSASLQLLSRRSGAP